MLSLREIQKTERFQVFVTNIYLSISKLSGLDPEMLLHNKNFFDFFQFYKFDHSSNLAIQLEI
jgi:hypothetical protein